MELRQYQKDSIFALQKGFKNNKRQVLCLPTGSGKTVIFSQMVYMSACKQTQTLVLTHRTELFEQTFKAIEKHGVKINRIEASTKTIDPNGTVFVGMVETISRRLKKGLAINPKLIIIDEAHFGNFNKIIEAYPDAFVIGATATPVGEHFYKYYTNIVEEITLTELIKQGFLCDYIGYQMQDFDDSKIKKVHGEFDEKQLFDFFDKTELYRGVVENWKLKVNGKKTIVFNCNIEHSEKTAQAFVDAGIESYSITSNTSKEDRKIILDRFSRGEFLVLNNCGVLTTGYDEPTIEVVIVNRATMSLPLWLQMCGRGSRIFNDKNIFYVLDFGKNHNRHGMWSMDRDWELKPKKSKKKKAPPVKDCPECGAVLPANVRQCEYCGYVFEREKDTKDTEKDGVLVEVKKAEYTGKKLSELTVSELIQLENDKKYSVKYIWRVLRARDSRGQLEVYARLKGYSKFWVNKQMDMGTNDFKDYTVR